MRDLSERSGGRIAPGRLFRGASLTNWQSDPFLREWLTANDIRLVIDLRVPGEGLDYNPEVLDGIRYEGVAVSSPEAPCGVGFQPAMIAESYMTTLRKSASQVAHVIRFLLRAEGPALVHCAHGVNRTGIVVAVLGVILGLGHDDIAEEYMASTGAVAGVMPLFLEIIYERGGTNFLLDALRLDESICDGLRRVFLHSSF